ncbi:hypothetical protein BB560_002882 [Smittium megazygosporum]|uniref:2'-phosphotransferase n=1 Tax=Smittium megazygosporum TaxID=133381 RepID=A0A2T9ZDJ6_9FUNG|nr:hypothetical protein BB560_002882 [Smittium megazygosporum]
MKKLYSELSPKDLSRYSRFMSSVLRHNASAHRLEMDPDGGVKLADFAKLPRFNNELSDPADVILKIVQYDNKKRYSIYKKAQGDFIRANQGHSIKLSEPPLRRVTSSTEIPVAVHGTFLDKWEKIKMLGLSRMNRQHIHLSPGMPGNSGVISGMRSNATVFIFIDTKKALDDSIPFFISDNNVILTPGNQDGLLPSTYFQRVEFANKK